MNLDGNEPIDERAIIQRLIDEFAIIEKAEPWVLREIGRAFNIDPNIDQSMSIIRAKAKIAEVLINQRSAFGDYLSLSKFKNISQQSRKVLNEVMAKTWSKFQQEIKVMSEKKFERQACSLIPNLRSMSQYESYHLNILRMYRESALCPKKFNNFPFQQYQNMFSSGNFMMNYQFPQRQFGGNKFGDLNQMRHPEMDIGSHMNTRTISPMNRMGMENGMIGINGMGNSNVNPGINQNQINPVISSMGSLHSINQQTSQGQKRKFPPNIEFKSPECVMQANAGKRRFDQDKLRQFNDTNPNYSNSYQKMDNKLKPFAFPNQGQWAPFNQKQIQSIRNLNYNFLNNGKFNQNSGEYRQRIQDQRQTFSDEKKQRLQVAQGYSGYKFQFANCRCQGQISQGGMNFFKCKECNYLYHFQCLGINQVPVGEIIIECPRCILRGRTIFQEVVEQFKLNWFVPKDDQTTWNYEIKKKDYKKAINSKNNKANFLIKLKFLKIKGNSFVQDYRNMSQKGYVQKRINQICVDEEQLINFQDDQIPLQVSISKPEYQNQNQQNLFIIGAFLIRKNSVATVEARYVEESTYHVGKQFIQSFFTNNPDVRVNMIDPIAHRPIKIATRGSHCLHSSIFDLHTFLVEAFEKKDRIDCPICGIQCSDLRIDDFLTQYISEIEKNITPMTITIYQNLQIRADSRLYGHKKPKQQGQDSQAHDQSDAEYHEQEQKSSHISKSKNSRKIKKNQQR